MSKIEHDTAALAAAQADGARQVLDAIKTAPAGLGWLRAWSMAARLELRAARLQQRAMDADLAREARAGKCINSKRIFITEDGPPWATLS